MAFGDLQVASKPCHAASCAAELRAIYSDSAVQRATTGCFLVQQITAPPKMNKLKC